MQILVVTTVLPVYGWFSCVVSVPPGQHVEWEPYYTGLKHAHLPDTVLCQGKHFNRNKLYSNCFEWASLCYSVIQMIIEQRRIIFYTLLDRIKPSWILPVFSHLIWIAKVFLLHITNTNEYTGRSSTNNNTE